MLAVKEALTKKELNDFFALPQILYRGNRYNAPSFIAEEKAEFDPKINGAFEFCIARKFVAYRDNKIVGRIAGIFNQKYNEKKNVKQVRFTRFDCIYDFDVARALIAKIEEWAQFLGMNEIIGPIGFSDMDKQGMLIEGFDEIDMYVTPYNHAYYPVLIEKLGYKKAADWVEYEIKIPSSPDEKLEKLERIAEIAMRRFGFTYLEVKKYKDIGPYIMEALTVVMNEAFAPLYGVAPINERQAKREADMIKLVFSPDFTTAVMKDGRVAGYGFMAPNITRGMQVCNGKLSIHGILAILRDLKKYDKVDFYSIGVLEAYQSKGVNAMILARGLKNLIKNKVKYVYTGPELETNSKVQAQWDAFEKRIHRRRRCYSKTL
ncbi:MAG: hypothetical protein FWE84_01495 [Firmicutes bacterium]|nr:hypothetical protein [Bacillota bacterium]